MATHRLCTARSFAGLYKIATSPDADDLCIYGAMVCDAANAATRLGTSSGSTMFAIAHRIPNQRDGIARDGLGGIDRRRAGLLSGVP